MAKAIAEDDVDRRLAGLAALDALSVEAIRDLEATVRPLEARPAEPSREKLDDIEAWLRLRQRRPPSPKSSAIDVHRQAVFLAMMATPTTPSPVVGLDHGLKALDKTARGLTDTWEDMFFVRQRRPAYSSYIGSSSSYAGSSPYYYDYSSRHYR